MQNHSILSPERVAALEKVPHAAKRMGISTCQLYREAKAGRITIVKVGVRASACNTAEVDSWIQARISEATKKGGAQC